MTTATDSKTQDIELIRRAVEMAKTGKPWWVEIALGKTFNAVIRTLDRVGFDARYVNIGGGDGREEGVYLHGTNMNTWWIYNRVNSSAPSATNTYVHPSGGAEFPRLLELLSNDPSMDDVTALWESVCGRFQG